MKTGEVSVEGYLFFMGSELDAVHVTYRSIWQKGFPAGGHSMQCLFWYKWFFIFLHCWFYLSRPLICPILFSFSFQTDEHYFGRQFHHETVGTTSFKTLESIFQNLINDTSSGRYSFWVIDGLPHVTVTLPVTGAPSRYFQSVKIRGWY